MPELNLEEKLKLVSEVSANISRLLEVRVAGAQALGMELLEDLRAWRIRNLSDELQEERKLILDEAAAVAKRRKELIEKEGPKLWAEWHKRALELSDANPNMNVAQDKPFLSGFVARIPCGECRAEFLKNLREMSQAPGETYFAYTVAVHNAVNRKLMKLELTVSEALKIWQK
jgi:hypothetical protein